MLRIKECFVRQNTGTGKISPQHFFFKVTTQMVSIIKANYVAANLIAEKSKPVTDGKFIKPCMESMADISCPD